jgi:uncharacterized membrane protein YgcG
VTEEPNEREDPMPTPFTDALHVGRRKAERQWWRTVALITAVVAVLVFLVVVSGASAHRPIGSAYAHRAANRWVHDHVCGNRGGWKCHSVSVPLVASGYHSYRWSGASHVECWMNVCLLGRRVRHSSGTVNGHTGQVVITRVW